MNLAFCFYTANRFCADLELVEGLVRRYPPLARDNVAGHTESVKSHHLGRLVSRVVNHGEKSCRLFDAFYNALKVTINYRRAHTVECVSRKRASVCVCLCRIHINLEHTAVAMPATSAE